MASVCSSAATVLTVWALKTQAYSTISSGFESDHKEGAEVDGLQEEGSSNPGAHDLEGSSVAAFL